MRKIAIYKNGSKGIIDTDSHSTILMDGQEPIEYIEATDENLKLYFPNYKKNPQIKLR